MYEIIRPGLSKKNIAARLPGTDPRSPKFFKAIHTTFLDTTLWNYWDPSAAPGAERLVPGVVPPYCVAGQFGGDDYSHVDWHHEPVHGVDWPRQYFPALSDYLSGSDLVLFWHLNKMWFLMDLAAAFAQGGDERYARDWFNAVTSWCDQNPFMVGMNWRSPFEIGTRLVTWSVGLATIGRAPWADEDRLAKIVESMMRQADYLAENFSEWRVSNNHLIGDAATLYVFAAFWPFHRDADRWKKRSEAVLINEAQRQVLPDGFQFENSVCYHVYVIDFFLMYLLARAARAETPPLEITAAVERLARTLVQMISPAGRLPRFGDDSMSDYFTIRSAGDLARQRHRRVVRFVDVVKPEFANVLAQCEWGRRLLDVEAPVEHGRHFEAAGYSVLRTPDTHLVSAAGIEHTLEISHGHVHSDGGSFELEIDAEPVVIDGGTYQYQHGEAIRNHFKGARAHNSVIVDGIDPMASSQTFAWKQVLGGRTRAFRSQTPVRLVASERRLPALGGAGVAHLRILAEVAAKAWVVIDRLSVVEGPARHRLEALFHTPFPRGEASLADRVARVGGYTIACLAHDGGDDLTLTLVTDDDDERSWYSPWYGELRRGTTVSVEGGFSGGIVMIHAIARNGDTLPRATTDGDRVELSFHTGEPGTVVVDMGVLAFWADGEPLPISPRSH